MPIVGQQWGLIHAASSDFFTHSQTIQVNNRNISAEIALWHVSQFGGVGITQIVSNSGVEQPDVPIVGRAGTTSITFTAAVVDSGCSARWIINHWE